MLTVLGITSLGLLTSACLTPVVRRAAVRLGLVDRPDGRRKLQAAPIALGGGVAVLAGGTVAVAAALAVPGPWQAALQAEWPFLAGLFAASLVVCVVGLLDDRIGLRGRQKLLGQLVAACAVAGSGLVIEGVQVFEWKIELGGLALPFTLFWLLGAINALNLLDGLDGLATSVGLILSAAVAGMAFLTGHVTDGLVALAVAGSLAGFLLHNFPPARIYLGDAGSMLIGLVIGALAIRSSIKGPATVALAAPTAILAIPIFDVSMAILRRKLTGRSIYTTDRGHLHHCLLSRGYSKPRALAWIGLLCAATAGGALVSVFFHNEFLALVSVLAVLGTIVATRFFGHAECVLLLRRLKGLLRSFLLLRRQSLEPQQPVCARLQGNREWESLWQTLSEFADRFDLNSVQLNVNLPALYEEYHVSWQRKKAPSNSETWSTDIPLVAQAVPVGRLRISGACVDGSVCAWMGDLIAGLRPFEVHLLSLLEDGAPEERIRALEVGVAEGRRGRVAEARRNGAAVVTAVEGNGHG